MTDRLSRASGFESVFRFSDLAAWRAGVRGVLTAAGPAFVLLDVAAVPGAKGPRSPGPTEERARRFRAALGAGEGAPT